MVSMGSMKQKPRDSFFLCGSKGRRGRQSFLAIGGDHLDEDGTLAERWLDTERDWFYFRHMEESYSNWQEL